MSISVIGIDIAKNVFQLHGIDSHGNVVLKERVSRKKFLPVLSNLPKCLIGMEACSTSNYWGRELTKLGHIVKLISPQYVKPYVKTNKNDSQDAEAICEAVTRPNMRFVAIKSIEQQDILSLHRVRSRLVSQRTALVNHVRALLSEYGIVLPQGITHIRTHLRPILVDTDNEITSILREVLYELLDEFLRLDERVKTLDHKLKGVCTQSDVCKRLLDIPGIGPITASALVSSIGDIHQFKNARHLSAWLGLVPKQHSSGFKQTLLGISKRGDTYLRKLLIHGARAVLFRYKQASEWMKAIVIRRGFNKACVALANKTTRIVWVLLLTGERYKKVSIRSSLS